jgi:two-component system CheB/CheR fusion protein
MREQLESTSAAYDRTVAELQAVNEELRSMIEEEKAAREELETGREENQSINEELTTINQEHQSSIEELKRTNADLHNLIESTEIGTIFLDRAMRIRRFTPGAADLFNLLTSDHGRPLGHITHRLDYPGLTDDIARVLASLQRIEREAANDAGESFIVRINPYRSMDGGMDGAVLTFFDNTAQHRVQQELREAKILAEAANTAKSAFLSTMSHEFRTPLNAMMGYADILEIGQPLTADQRTRVDRIKAGGRHLVAIIDDLLEFTRLDSGTAVPIYHIVDGRSIAAEAHALMVAEAEVKGLTIKLHLPETAVPLETDVDKARQILLNLCGNAIKFTPPGGEIDVRVAGRPGQVLFEISDNGIGISAVHHARIFDRFWQVDGGVTRAGGGMGIGLAAAREYGLLLGGDVEVESELGRGSTFRLRLPAAPERRSS